MNAKCQFIFIPKPRAQEGATEVLTVAAIFVTRQRVCRKSATLRFLYNRPVRVSRI